MLANIGPSDSGFEVVPVPEPSVFALFTLAAIVVVGMILFMRTLTRRAGEVLNAIKPPAQPPMQSAPRKCPQCGADLKPDAPEGLCPACLLKRGIATEGGVPPGTPPFTPPSLAELAKLFPQLEIIEPIGQGGMGAVYKARQPALDRLVALKILAPRGGGDVDFASRFTREARALAKLNHPNIVAVHDFGQVSLASTPDPRPLNYFLMEYVDGPNLRQLEQAGKLTPREALQIVPQICTALQFAHDEGVVHRDIKPENVLLDKKGRVKIADFGLAKILGQETDFRLTGARDVMGTPHYMAPEQVEKPQEVDHRADIYSLGVVFYEMLTGELPLGRFEPPSHRAQVDIRLDEVVLRSLEKSPERRYQHVSEVKTHVETIATSAARPQATAKTAASTPPRFQSIAFTVASCLMALLLLSIGWSANQMGVFFNALFLFILLMVPMRIVLILSHTYHGTVECGLWRTPLAPELSKYRWRVVNRWVFWLLAAVVLQICIVPAQFSPAQLTTVRLVVTGSVVLLILLELLPPRRSYLATNAVYVVGSIFMIVQIARIYWPESKAHAVVLSMPVRGDWLVVNGGNSSLINIHYPFKEQRNALDIEKLVNGRERTGDAHKLESYPSWGETVYAPADGKIAVAQRNLDDNVVGEVDRDNPVGNHICIDMGDGRYVLLAHLQKGSLKVAEGDTVHAGEPLAKCGNSGNTSHPHLHIQVQDAPRIFVSGKGDATTYPILFRDAARVRADQTANGAPFFVRRNDQLIREAEAVKKNDPPKITLNGITTILGKKQSLLTVPGSTPGTRSEDLMLAEGQAQNDVEVREIDEKAGVVKVVNHGVLQTLQVNQGSANPASIMAIQALVEQPPVVVETIPASGAQNVPAGEIEIRVRFSKAMSDGSWSWCSTWEDSMPQALGRPRFLDDGRTCVLKIRLEPGRTYGFWLNSDSDKNFKDREGRPAVPYLLTFQTQTKEHLK
jgi:murein DD-endopeptidase MepM/ murein hydrolase activator NlpD